jgi:hypothetical protein
MFRSIRVLTAIAFTVALAVGHGAGASHGAHRPAGSTAAASGFGYEPCTSLAWQGGGSCSIEQ